MDDLQDKKKYESEIYQNWIDQIAGNHDMMKESTMEHSMQQQGGTLLPLSHGLPPDSIMIPEKP